MGRSLNERNSGPALWTNGRELAVGRDACRLAIAGERLVARQVWSDIALAIHIPGAGFAALLRFSLPKQIGASGDTSDPNTCNPWISADTAIPLLLASVASLRLESRDISAFAVGGADLENGFTGRRNQIALRRALRSEGIRLQGEDLGGSSSRAFWFDAACGRPMIRTDPGRRWQQPTEIFGEAPESIPLSGSLLKKAGA